MSAEAEKLRAVIGTLASQIAAGRPPVELMETIREGTRSDSGESSKESSTGRVTPERRATSGTYTSPGRMTFSVLEKE